MILPVLPSRNAVLLPGAVVELLIGRPAAVAALRVAEPDVLVLLQRDGDLDDPGPDGFHGVGTIGTPVDAQRVTPEAASVALAGGRRVRVVSVKREGDGLFAEIEPLPWEPAMPALTPEVLEFLGDFFDVGVAEELSARARAALKRGSPIERLCAVALMAASPPEEMQAALDHADLAPIAERVAQLHAGTRGPLQRLARWFQGD